jgi:hypothetical protein
MSVIPQTPEFLGGFAPLVPYQGSALDPSPTHTSLTTNPGSASDHRLVKYMYISMRRLCLIHIISNFQKFAIILNSLVLYLSNNKIIFIKFD